MKQEWKSQSGTLKVYDCASKTKSARAIAQTLEIYILKLLEWPALPNFLMHSSSVSPVQGSFTTINLIKTILFQKPSECNNTDIVKCCQLAKTHHHESSDYKFEIVHKNFTENHVCYKQSLWAVKYVTNNPYNCKVLLVQTLSNSTHLFFYTLYHNFSHTFLTKKKINIFHKHSRFVSQSYRCFCMSFE